MAEALWEVPEERTRAGVDLFGEQPERVRSVAQGLIDPVRLVEPALMGEVVDEPEAAQEERFTLLGVSCTVR